MRAAKCSRDTFEQYLRPLGMIQAGFFYKDISDPIYTVRTPITSGFLPPAGHQRC